MSDHAPLLGYLTLIRGRQIPGTYAICFGAWFRSTFDHLVIGTLIVAIANL